MTDTVETLKSALNRAPVMGQFHPLVPLCLSPKTLIFDDPLALLEFLDSPEPHPEKPVLLTKLVSFLNSRLRTLNHSHCPPTDIINTFLSQQITVARRRLLTHHRIADTIVADVRQHQYQTVILFLVDGLSYADVLSWPEEVQPCFIDGPSITFSRTPNGSIDPQVGFPTIVGQPPLAKRLYQLGLRYARGFSYWERSQNDVTAHLFDGMPLEQVHGFSAALERLQTIQLSGTYIQIVREGLDGLAHSRRELNGTEIEATKTAIHQDLKTLVSLLQTQNLRGAVYLTADHGILWKNQTSWQQISDGPGQHSRYYKGDVSSNHTTHIATERQSFYLYHYPYLDRKIKSNDSGTHGGLSFQESIVPFVRVEVNPT